MGAPTEEVKDGPGSAGPGSGIEMETDSMGTEPNPRPATPEQIAATAFSIATANNDLEDRKRQLLEILKNWMSACWSYYAGGGKLEGEAATAGELQETVEDQLERLTIWVRRKIRRLERITLVDGATPRDWIRRLKDRVEALEDFAYGASEEFGTDSVLGTAVKADRLAAKITRGIFPDRAEETVLPLEGTTLDIVFDGPPSEEGPRFVEAEVDGAGVKAGEWVEGEDGMWRLKIGLPYVVRRDVPARFLLWKKVEDRSPSVEGTYLCRWLDGAVRLMNLRIFQRSPERGFEREWWSHETLTAQRAPEEWADIPGLDQAAKREATP